QRRGDGGCDLERVVAAEWLPLAVARRKLACDLRALQSGRERLYHACDLQWVLARPRRPARSARDRRRRTRLGLPRRNLAAGRLSHRHQLIKRQDRPTDARYDTYKR